MRTNGFVGKENMGKTDFVGGVVEARRRGCGFESCDLIYPRCTLQEKPGKTGFPTDNPEERIISKRNIQEKQVFNGKTWMNSK